MDRFVPNFVGEAYRNLRPESRADCFAKGLDFIEFNEDGVLLLGITHFTSTVWSGTIRLFKDPKTAPNFQNCWAGLDYDSGVTDAKFLNDKNKIFLCDDSGLVQIVTLTEMTGATTYLTTVESNPAHTGAVLSVELFSDKNRAVTGGTDSSITLWNTEGFCVEKSYYPAHGHHITSLTTHVTDKNIFLSTSLDCSCLLWDTRLEKPASLLDKNDCGFSSSCWINENSVVVGHSTGCISLYDLRMKNELDRNFCSNRGVHKLKMNPVLKFIAACFDDSTVQVFECKNDLFNNLYKFDKHGDFVRGLAWEPKTNILYTCGWDGQVLNHQLISDSNSSDE